MKIIQISPSYKPATVYGGPTVSIAKLCEVLSTKCNIEVMTTTANGKTELPILSGSNHFVKNVSVQYFSRITKDHTHFSPCLLWHLHKKLRNNKTILHVHSWWNLVAILSCVIARLNNNTVILSPRGMLTSYSLNNRNSIFKSFIHSLIGKRLISGSHLHATSDQEKFEIMQMCSPKSISVISNFVTLPEVQHSRSLASTSSFPFKLIFLSRIDEKKGLELLFKALESCYFSWQLTVAGTGEYRYVQRLKKLAKSLNISASIIWAGHIDDEEKYKVIGEHDLLVLFSHNENFANVITESLACGTPVLISVNVGLAPYVKENDLGWVAEFNHPALVAALNNAYIDVKKRLRINNIAPALIRTHFSEHQILEQYLKLYHKLS